MRHSFATISLALALAGPLAASLELTDLGTGLVSELPVAPTKPIAVIVTDGASATDCSTGSGSHEHVCFWDGAAYQAIQIAGGALVGDLCDADGDTCFETDVDGSDSDKLGLKAGGVRLVTATSDEVVIARDDTYGGASFRIEQDGSGDAAIGLFAESQDYTIGIDGSEVGGPLVFSASQALGNNDLLTIASSGNIVANAGNFIGPLIGNADTATTLSDGDKGDVSVSSGVITLDADVVAAAEMADADHGDVAWSGGVASVEGGTADKAVQMTADYSVSLYRSAGLTLSNNTSTPLEWDAEEYDHDFAHSTSSNEEHITIPVPGLYLFSGVVSFASNGTGLRRVSITNDAGTIIHRLASGAGSGSGVDAFAFAKVVALAGSSVVEIEAFQSSGGNLALSTGSVSTNLQVTLLRASS